MKIVRTAETVLAAGVFKSLVTCAQCGDMLGSIVDTRGNAKSGCVIYDNPRPFVNNPEENALFRMETGKNLVCGSLPRIPRRGICRRRLAGLVGICRFAARVLIPPREEMPDQVGHDGMVIDQKILDDLTGLAKTNPRLRQAMDLRNSPEDASQRTLNAIEPGTVMPVHRHKNSSETCVCVRGHFEEYFYDELGNLTDTIDMVPGGIVLNIEKGRWHSLKSLESGTVLLEAKDGPYHPLEADEVMEG